MITPARFPVASRSSSSEALLRPTCAGVLVDHVEPGKTLTVWAPATEVEATPNRQTAAEQSVIAKSDRIVVVPMRFRMSPIACIGMVECHGSLISCDQRPSLIGD